MSGKGAGESLETQGSLALRADRSRPVASEGPSGQQQSAVPQGQLGLELPWARLCVQRAGGTIPGEGFLKLTFNFLLLKMPLKPGHSGL